MWTSGKDRFAGCLPGGAKSEALQSTFQGKPVLFFIERSNNDNTVVYEADWSNAADPVKVYWIMYSNSPVNEEGLTMIERNTAYGSKTEKAGAGWSLSLSALPSKKITVSKGPNGELSASTLINGAEMQLVSIYVKSTTSWGMPSVEYIDVKGKGKDGAFVTERIKK